MESLIGLLGGVPPAVALALVVVYFNKENEKMRAAIKEQENALSKFKEISHEETAQLRTEVNSAFQNISTQIANLSNTVIAAVSRK
jgi:uncharacterized protein YoxC